MNEETVDLIEIWRPSNVEGEARMGGKCLKLVAYIVNGVAISLENGYVMERRIIPKVEAEYLLPTKSN